MALDKKEIFVVFRMDDYSEVTDTSLELRIVEIFQKKKIGLTFGVVPFACSGNDKDPSPQELIPLSGEKANLLRTSIKTGFLDIALHGYSHQANGSSEASEFAGLGYDVQVERIAAGKKFIEEITGFLVDCFIPPWNQYDLNTLRALEESGIKTLSAGWKGVAAKNSKLRFLPATCDLKSLTRAVDDARISSDRQPVIVVLFHHYDFTELKDKRASTSLQDFSGLLDWLVSQKDLRLGSVSYAVDAINDLSSNRFLVLEKWRSLEKFLPTKLREKKPVFLYHETGIFRKACLRVCSIYALFSLLFFVGAFIASFYMFSSFPVLGGMITSGVVALTFCVLFYAFKGYSLSPKGLALSICSVGVSIGVFCGYLLTNSM